MPKGRGAITKHNDAYRRRCNEALVADVRESIRARFCGLPGPSRNTALSSQFIERGTSFTRGPTIMDPIHFEPKSYRDITTSSTINLSGTFGSPKLTVNNIPRPIATINKRLPIHLDALRARLEHYFKSLTIIIHDDVRNHFRQISEREVSCLLSMFNIQVHSRLTRDDNLQSACVRSIPLYLPIVAKILSCIGQIVIDDIRYTPFICECHNSDDVNEINSISDTVTLNCDFRVRRNLAYWQPHETIGRTIRVETHHYDASLPRGLPCIVSEYVHLMDELSRGRTIVKYNLHDRSGSVLQLYDDFDVGGSCQSHRFDVGDEDDILGLFMSLHDPLCESGELLDQNAYLPESDQLRTLARQMHDVLYAGT